MTARVDDELWACLEGDPDAQVEAILVASGSLEELLASLPAGIVVQHRYRRLPGLAVLASARLLRRIAELPTVRAMESVRRVHTF